MRRNLTSTALALISATVIAFGFASSVARTQEEEEIKERKFVNTVPEHVPIKVKLKHEQSFKNPKNKNWARELEVEVKNTGDKPIYYLYVIIVMPDVLLGGHRQTMRTTYGRPELGLPETPVGPDDVPIMMPGETLTVKLPQHQVGAYEQGRDERGKPDPKVVEFEMQAVKFGDGTSFRGRSGAPFREATKDKPLDGPRSEVNSEGCKPGGASKLPDLFGSLLAFHPVKPASLLRAYLLPPDDGSALAVPPSSPRES